MTRRYSTRQDAIEQDLVPVLDAFAGDYDLEAIAAEVYDYRVSHDGDGNELLNTAGFEQVVSDEDFWAIVKRHQISAPI